MSKVAVSLKIDVSKIDKARLFKGKKGTYLDAQVFIELDEQDQYGNNGMITQAVSKEEKDQGVNGNILGNCKIFWREQAQQTQPAPVQQPQSAPAQPAQPAPGFDDFDDDVPF